MSAISAIEHPALKSGKHDDLLVAAEDIRAFRHEMHTAKHDILRIRSPRLVARVSENRLENRQIDDFIPLVMVAKNYDVFTELSFGGRDSCVERMVGYQEIGMGIAANTLLNLGRDRKAVGSGLRGFRYFSRRLLIYFPTYRLTLALFT